MDTVYFTGMFPDWFINQPVETKCNIIAKLAEELKNEKPLNKEQMEELFSCGQ